MRFALLGNHPDGVDLAEVIRSSGRHQLSVCAGMPEVPTGWEEVKRVSDIEEILADPAIEAAIVAGPPSIRPEQLRRALQSERHVLCVQPADVKPDIAYEAAMIQRDTGYVLMPILPEALHPAIARLGEFIDRGAGGGGETRSLIGQFHLLTFERAATGEVLDNTHEGLDPCVPGWDVLRRLGGEAIEVSALSEGEEMEAGRPVLLAGRFVQGGLFQVTLLPRQPAARWRFVVLGTDGQAELTFPLGWNGPAWLEYREDGQRREQYWEPFDPWPEVLRAFEVAVDKQPGPISWQDAIRGLELDDAARRSVERRRVNLMDYQEASEEVGFKGTMTLLGCSLLWGVLLLLIASRWVPWLAWVILPVLVIFVGLQLLRYIIPAPEEDKTKTG